MTRFFQWDKQSTPKRMFDDWNTERDLILNPSWLNTTSPNGYLEICHEPFMYNMGIRLSNIMSRSLEDASLYAIYIFKMTASMDSAPMK